MIKRLLRLVFFLVTLWLIGLFAYVYGVQTMDSYQGKADGIVVLTGGEGRVEAGLLLLANHKADRLLISGVYKKVKVPEILAMYHQDQKLAAAIDIDPIAQDTLGNAGETAVWVEKYAIKSLIVVTAHYHMPRALVHLGAQMPEVALYPYPIVAGMFSGSWIYNRQAWLLLAEDYTKFLLTYPQIFILGHVRG